MSTTFSMARAFEALDIKTAPFDNITQSKSRGYSFDRNVAINPKERWPELVTFHEIGHILKGETALTSELVKRLEKLGPDHPDYNRIFDEAMEIRDRNYDLLESECHMIAITAALLTGIPFDLEAEIEHLSGYTHGRQLPKNSLDKVARIARQIAKAGKVEMATAA